MPARRASGLNTTDGAFTFRGGYNALFSSAELAEVFGRDMTVHVAVRRGGIADRLARDCARLAGFRQI